MNRHLRIIDRNGPEFKALQADFWRHEENWGLMWRMPDDDIDGRESWFIVLPNNAGGWQTTDRSAIRGSTEMGPRWEVTGEPPEISVSPSIDASPHWHGWIRNGAFTE